MSEEPDEVAEIVLGEDDERSVPCEACNCEGVVADHVCRACDGWGWREP